MALFQRKYHVVFPYAKINKHIVISKTTMAEKTP